MRRALLLAFAVFAAAPAFAAEGVDEATQRILKEEQFPFCRPNENAMPPRSRGWCEIEDQATSCPQIKEMCAREWKGRFSWADGDGEGKKKKPKAEVGGDNPGGGLKDFNLHLPGAQALAWIVIGLVVAFIAVLIVRAIADRNRNRADLPEPEPEAMPAALVFADPGLGEVAAMLARSRAEADRDVGRAMQLLYAAALRWLEDKGLIHWDIATTNREYVRQVRGKHPLDRPLAELVREVERTKFGHSAPQRTAFEGLYQRIATLLTALAFAFLVGCGGGDPSLEGRAAFSDLLRSQGIEPTRFAMPIDKFTGNDPPVLVDVDAFDIDADVQHALAKALASGGRILLLLDRGVVLPAWPSLSVVDKAKKPLHATEEFARERVLPVGQGALPGGWALKLDEVGLDKPQVLVERGGEPFAVEWKTETGVLVVVADRRLFANGSMAVPANARLAAALVREVVGDQKTLAYAVLGPADYAENPAESLGRAGLLPLLLQALLVLGVFFLARSRGFGTLRERLVRRRRAFSEHVQALGIQLSRREGSRYAASLYAAYALERLWLRIGRVVDRHDMKALAQALAQRLGEDEAEVLRVLERADQARREPNGFAQPTEDLLLVRRLGDMLARLQSEPSASSQPREAA